MKKILFFKFFMMQAKIIRFTACCMAVLSSAVYLSCDDIYDNIKEFSVKEKVYPAHFDYVYGRVGFERVEIDLSQYGRIPSSQMNLGKAKKTVIIYDNKTIVYDSLCSWVEITGLSMPKLYRFTIYTEDEHQNRSTPVEIALTPYTSSDRDALALPEPVFLESTTVALVEWKNRISNNLYEMLDYSYKYVNRMGDTVRGSGDGDFPSFFIENVTWGELVTVMITSRIIPRLDNIPIIDTIMWSYPMIFAVEGTRKTVFLDHPFADIALSIENSFPFNLSWKKAEGVNDYSIKISHQATFNPDETSIIHVGDADSYDLKADDFTVALQNSYYGNAPLYWTVVPASEDPSILTQSRRLYVQRKIVKSYMLELTSAGERWTTHTYEPETNTYEIHTNGNNDNSNDPYLWTVGLPEAITEKALALSYEYRTKHQNPSKVVWEFEYFFATPNAVGGQSVATKDIPIIDEWRSFTYELGTIPIRWGWGKAGHRLRLDTDWQRGLQLWLKDIRIDVYE